MVTGSIKGSDHVYYCITATTIFMAVSIELDVNLISLVNLGPLSLVLDMLNGKHDLGC